MTDAYARNILVLSGVQSLGIGMRCRRLFHALVSTRQASFLLGRPRFMLLLVLVMLAGACGGTEEGQRQVSACSGETRADTYVQGLEKSGDIYRIRLLEAIPGPPEVGDNQWTFELYKDAGKVSTATITVRPWMPDHGHGTTPMYYQATASSNSDTFELGAIDLFMPGFWTMTFQVDEPSVSDEIVFGFCLEG